MNKRRPRPLTPLGTWVKTQSVLKGITLKAIAENLGILPQNLSAKMRGDRHFRNDEISKLEEILGEKYSESRSA